MTPAQLHADIESVDDAEQLSSLGRDNERLVAAAHHTMFSPICDQCALRLGAIAPSDHVATLRPDVCTICEQDRVCASLDDWTWTRMRFVRRPTLVRNWKPDRRPMETK